MQVCDVGKRCLTFGNNPYIFRNFVNNYIDMFIPTKVGG